MNSNVSARVRRAPPPVVLGGSLGTHGRIDTGIVDHSVMPTSRGAEFCSRECEREPTRVADEAVLVSDNVYRGVACVPQGSPVSRHHLGSANAERPAVGERFGYVSTSLAHKTSKTEAGEAALRSHADSWVLQRLAFFPHLIYRVLHTFGFVKDEDFASASTMLLCACAAVGALLILLLATFASLVMVVVVMGVHNRQYPLDEASGLQPDPKTKTCSGGTCGTPASFAGVGRLLDSEGLKSFLHDAHRAAELRRRVGRNASLLAALQKASMARGNNGGGIVDLVSLAQTLPELRHLSFLLYEVSAHVRAIHEHDPVNGLVELSNFLLHAKGRERALEKAAERARAEASNATAAQTGKEGQVPDIGGTAAKWSAALTESFSGHSEAARLRAQLRGFISVSAQQTERLSEQPFDDLAMLQYRHAWMQSEVLPMMRDRRRLRVGARDVEGGTPIAAVLLDSAANLSRQNMSANVSSELWRSVQVSVNRMAMKADLYEAASIFNHVYYYPLHRYSARRRYDGGSSVADTDFWYSAIAAVVQARFGVPINNNINSSSVETLEDAKLPLTQRDAPLSLLALPRLGVERAEEVEHLYSQEDQQLMPQALNSRDVVNTHSIFVSLASYRDAECAPTLMGIFRAARNPHRIYVGLAQQNHAGDSPCLLPEMYTPYLCPSEGLEGPSADGSVAAARESRARARTLYGTGGDFSGNMQRPEARLFDARVCFLADQVRVREIDSKQAKGPTYGRYMAMLLYRGERLTLVLDSHNRFRPMWDTFGATMLRRMDDPKAVLSHYPESYEGDQVDLQPYRTTTAYLCRAHFLQAFGYLRLNGIVVRSPVEFADRNVYNDPYVDVKSWQIDPAHNYRLPQPWVAGGFLISYATIYRDVPFDPHLPYIFDGEEVLYSVRLWTHGYNLYSPPRGLCFHIYGRTSAPKVWDDSPLWHPAQNHIRDRVRFFLQMHNLNDDRVRVPANTTNPFVVVDASRYGIGKQRTVEEWYRYAGANPITYELDGRWCGKDTSK
ncbi:hypothetical protein JKF63_07567 [Porcisia hertigi]|uniref:Uncharacterized protein n=1 Tax=Porcisia hertigi TaxID=2761500 RepID=A0A836YI10_9TRYP|nr:hypothetical protein JKF63_07567 [Porcisia hertigi]